MTFKRKDVDSAQESMTATASLEETVSKPRQARVAARGKGSDKILTERLRDAFETVWKNAPDVRASFLDAFHHRAKDFWKAEADVNLEAALAGAFQKAMASYEGRDPLKDIADVRTASVDEPAWSVVHAAIKRAFDPYTVNRFQGAIGMRDSGASWTPEHHVRGALISYVIRKNAGSTSDPW